MKFVEHDGNFQIAPDDVVSYNTLPAGYYKINYDAAHDIYSLDRTYEFTITESKIYGVQTEKLHKVTKAYDISNRSLGVLLSGDKGIGKSLFAKLLCMSMYAKGKAIIIIDKSYKGLERFLSDIPGDVVFLFDEFDKVFHVSNDTDGRDESSQESLLSVFDGTGTQKRMFIITANDIDDLAKCLINRAGRFHYHFMFQYPTDKEIIEYCKDNMTTYNQTEVDKLINLSKIIKLNYDSLRSIIFEFNMGQKLEEFIDDLNIKSFKEIRYVYKLKTKDGEEIKFYTPQSDEYWQPIDQIKTIYLADVQTNWSYQFIIKLNEYVSNNIIKGGTYEFIDRNVSGKVNIDESQDIEIIHFSATDKVTLLSSLI